jgi:glycoprotein 6-alpha-L-fucosyltransferase
LTCALFLLILAHEQEAIIPHFPNNELEIELEIGDIITISEKHWDGHSIGHNRRTGKIGSYPSYKVKEKWRIVDFPTYQLNYCKEKSKE